MLVAIVRHAEAEREAVSGVDADRALTARGERQAEYLGGKFAAWSVRPEVVVASRARRARETARSIAAACGVDFDFDDRLLVDAPVSGAVDVVREHAGSRFVALVGHNDQVSDLCLVLVRGVGRGSAADSGQWDDLKQMATGRAVVLRVVKAEVVGGCEVVDAWRLGE